MPGNAAARSRSQRKADTLEKLRTGVDLWIASASEDGRAYLVPLSYYWDGSTLTLATPRHAPAAPTSRSARFPDRRSGSLGTPARSPPGV